MNDPDMRIIFDRRVQRQQCRRAARGDLAAYDFLHQEVAARLADRLQDIVRRFEHCLELGCHGGQLSTLLRQSDQIGWLARTDPSPAMIKRSQGQSSGIQNGEIQNGGFPGADVVGDEEFLPFAPESFDLVISALALQNVNDLPGALVQIRQSLKPDGLFLAAFLGGESLRELRHAFMQAELAVSGGAHPRVAPMVDLSDAAGLLQRAGFALPVADLDRLNFSYPDPLSLMRELRGMGLGNTLHERLKTFTRRQVLFNAATQYQEIFGTPDGRIPATFDIIYLAGWAPHPDQPKPLARGSGQISLADALKS